MRSLIRLLVIWGAFVLGIVACTTPPTPVYVSEAEATQTAVGPLTATPLLPAEPVAVSIQIPEFAGFWVSPTDPYTEIVQALRYETLLAVDRQGQLVPLLAESLPVVTDDGLGWRIPVRSDITFQNGEPLTAARVAAVLQHQMEGSAQVTLAEYVLVQLVASVALDGSDIVVQLHRSFDSFPALLAEPCLAIRHEDGSGTGPFALVDENDAGMTFEAFQGYHGGLPYVAHVDVIIVPSDVSIRVSAFDDPAQSMISWENTHPQSWMVLDTRPFPLSEQQLVNTMIAHREDLPTVLANLGLPDGFDMPVWITSPWINGRLEATTEALWPIITMPEVKSLAQVASGMPLLTDGVPRAMVMTIHHGWEKDWWQQFLAFDGPILPLDQVGLPLPGGDFPVIVSDRIAELAVTGHGWPRIIAETRVAEQE